MKLSNKYPFWFIVSLYSCIWIFSINQFFFWDTVQLASKHATYFYTQQLKSFILPTDIDSGHIPAFGYYLACIWELLGRSLWVSHVAMLPFIVGIFIQSYRLIRYFIPRTAIYWAFALFLFDPTLMAQSALVSPDIPLVFFLLLSLNGIIYQQRKLFILALCGLVLISMRGITAAACIGLFDLYYSRQQFQTYKLKRLADYAPAILIAISYLYFHYRMTGWILIHADSPWHESFERVDIKGVLKNIILYIWRLVDFGRIGIWVIALFIISTQQIKKYLDDKTYLLITLFLIFLLLFPINTLWAKGLTGHRYYLPIYLIFSLLTLRLLFSLSINDKIMDFLIAGWIAVITAGCFLVYPSTIAQGWDATPAHFPYYALRKQALEYLDQKQLADTTIQSFFPNNSVRDLIDLDGNSEQYQTFDGNANYVFYSTVFNLSDQDLNLLENKYNVLKKYKIGQIEVYLLKNKKLICK